ncbi:hypothetical protein [Rhodococcus pyridinivorans]|uniref:hypothetical protein n=1 Tax=Rhodococcus pyridinivorans TaxID=103816 RepID=UPI0004125E5E|nr:hypothetical protein [Rhodococcus pyridinivorans]
MRTPRARHFAAGRAGLLSGLEHQNLALDAESDGRLGPAAVDVVASGGGLGQPGTGQADGAPVAAVTRARAMIERRMCRFLLLSTRTPAGSSGRGGAGVLAAPVSPSEMRPAAAQFPALADRPAPASVAA